MKNEGISVSRKSSRNNEMIHILVKLICFRSTKERNGKKNNNPLKDSIFEQFFLLLYLFDKSRDVVVNVDVYARVWLNTIHEKTLLSL